LFGIFLRESRAPTLPPGVQFRAKCKDRTQFVMLVTVNRHRFAPFPPLHRPNIALQIRRDFLPRVEPVVRLSSNGCAAQSVLRIVQSALQPITRCASKLSHQIYGAAIRGIVRRAVQFRGLPCNAACQSARLVRLCVCRCAGRAGNYHWESYEH
jgi:hypothetical protein